MSKRQNWQPSCAWLPGLAAPSVIAFNGGDLKGESLTGSRSLRQGSRVEQWRSISYSVGMRVMESPFFVWEARRLSWGGEISRLLRYRGKINWGETTITSMERINGPLRRLGSGGLAYLFAIVGNRKVQRYVRDNATATDKDESYASSDEIYDTKGEHIGGNKMI